MLWGRTGSSAEFTDWSEALFQNQYYRLIVGRVINLTNAPIKKTDDLKMRQSFAEKTKKLTKG